MGEFLGRLFDPAGFVPRRECGAWNQQLMLLHIGSDAAIWLAYLAIPIVLVYFVRRRRDIPFSWMFLMFGLFIVSCGFTHFMEIVLFYDPLYRLAGLVKLVTALASVATVIGLIPLIPKVLTLRSPRDLEREIAERRRAEAKLAAVNADLEQQAAELERFNRLAVDREQRMIDLKRQVNELARELGRPRPHDVAFADETPAQGAG